MDTKSSSSSREGVPVATHDGENVSGPFKDETGPTGAPVTSFTGAGRRASAAGTTNIIENPLTVSNTQALSKVPTPC